MPPLPSLSSKGFTSPRLGKLSAVQAVCQKSQSHDGEEDAHLNSMLRRMSFREELVWHWYFLLLSFCLEVGARYKLVLKTF